MEIDETGVGADAPASSPEANSQPDPLKNLKAEMDRKLSKLNKEVTSKVDQILAAVAPRAAAPAEDADDDAPITKSYVDAQFVRKGQESAWTQALELFPELNKDSESFDEKFFQTADAYFSSFDLKKDKDAPLKAVKLAALELGKIEQLTKEKLLKDEARRSRIIAEGGSTPRENKKAKEVKLNEVGLARLGIKNPEKLRARIKAETSGE